MSPLPSSIQPEGVVQGAFDFVVDFSPHGASGVQRVEIRQIAQASQREDVRKRAVVTQATGAPG